MPKLSHSLRAENRTKIIFACIAGFATVAATTIPVSKLIHPRPKTHRTKRISSNLALAPLAKPNAQASQPTAQCKDGTLSYASEHVGACSNHGGVKVWLR